MPTDSPAAPADILDDLLSPPADDLPFPGHEGLTRLFSPAVALPPRQTAPALSRPAAPSVAVAPHPRSRQSAKIKTTHYLDAAVHARLGRVRDALADARNKDLGRVSKSRIVEAALVRALAEFEAEGRESRLCHDLETTTPDGM